MKPGGQLSIFVPINKIDEEQRLVYGQVAAEVLDNSGEMFDYEGSKPYFEKWSENAFATSGGKSKGNLRVMHTSKVAGIVSDIAFDDENRTIDACTKVVDDGEWAMVLAGGYTGFSMGGRYVSRATKSDGVKSYIADPVEISLVDKPCIPTATFSVVKADGLTETHRFREDLYKTDTGDEPMSVYVPTNDEILPVAQGLAKADGKPDTAWLDYVEAATAELISKHDTGPSGANAGTKDGTKSPAKDREKEVGPIDDAEIKDPAPGSDKAKKADAAHDPEACDKADCADCAAAKADNPFADKGKKEGEEDDDAADDKDEAEAGKKAKKADEPEAPELSQGWQAKDGSFHLKKADALAHNATLNKAAEGEPSLVDTLKATLSEAEAIVKGDAAEEPAADAVADDTTLKATTIAVFAAPLAKFKEFADNTLVKGMYSVRRLAEIIAGLDELHCMVACEEAWEDDQTSKLPQMLMDGMKNLGTTLVAMATEEVNEMLASAAMMDSREGSDDDAPIVIDTVIVELAASTLGLEKADAETSLQKRLADRKPTDEVIPPTALAKMAKLETETADAVAKATKLEGEMAEIAPLVKGLQGELAKIKAMPMPKAPTMVIGKGEGAGPASDAPLGKTDLIAQFGPDALADAAFRMAHSQGRHFVLPTGNGGQ